MLTIGKSVAAIALLVVAVAYCEFSTAIISHVPANPLGNWLYAAQGITVVFVCVAACTMVFSILSPAIIPNWYFASKSIERDGRIYRFAGVHIFESILRRIGWEKLLRKDTPIRNDITALRKYADMTRGAEAIHMAAAILTAIFTITVALRYPLVSTRWWWISNVLVNVYPIMLQRYNRPRVQRLICRLERHLKSTP